MNSGPQIHEIQSFCFINFEIHIRVSTVIQIFKTVNHKGSREELLIQLSVNLCPIKTLHGSPHLPLHPPSVKRGNPHQWSGQTLERLIEFLA